MAYVWDNERSLVYTSFQNTPDLSKNLMLTTRVQQWWGVYSDDHSDRRIAAYRNLPGAGGGKKSLK